MENNKNKETFNPQPNKDSHKTNETTNEINVATIGGGSGSFQVLLALKKIPNVKISAIVSMSDNGGSTGILRTMYGILPPGDVRNCLVALSNDVSKWVKVFNYRFDEKLNKHSLGNLILTALTHIHNSFEDALKTAHEMLNITDHQVLPITYTKTNLKAKFEDGEIIIGESQITEYAYKTKQHIKELYLTSDSEIIPNPKAIEAIINADFIIFGPGSLYTSVLPNLIVPGVKEALKKSKAKKILIVNIMSDAETYKFKASDFINVIEKYVKLDCIIINSKRPSVEMLKKYEGELKYFVENDVNDKNKDTHLKIISADILNEDHILRHDDKKLSRVLHWIFIDSKYDLTK